MQKRAVRFSSRPQDANTGNLGWKLIQSYQAYFFIAYGPERRPTNIEAHKIQALTFMNPLYHYFHGVGIAKARLKGCMKSIEIDVMHPLGRKSPM